MFNVNNYDLNTKDRSIEETSSEIDSDSFIVSDNRTISVVSSTEGINNYFFGIRDTERTINGQAQKNPKKKKKKLRKIIESYDSDASKVSNVSTNKSNTPKSGAVSPIKTTKIITKSQSVGLIQIKSPKTLFKKTNNSNNCNSLKKDRQKLNLKIKDKTIKKIDLTLDDSSSNESIIDSE